MPVKEDAGEWGLSVLAVPVDMRGNGHSWLVMLRAEDSTANRLRSAAWVLMAPRVARDLKNPLTPMLLTQQRIQMEYQEKAPELAPVLDAYTARIVDRIEHLRRSTKNFMKFVD